MARMAGVSVIRALEMIVQTRIHIATTALIPKMRGLAELPAIISKNVEQIILEMQKAVFEDLSWQHEAYLAGGISEMQIMLEANQIDNVTYHIWKEIDDGISTGNATLLWQGNTDLLQREQQIVLAPGYASLALIPGVANAMTLSIENPFPGGGPFPDPITGNITIFEQRWSWLQTQVVAVWQSTPAATRNLIMQKTLLQLVRGE